MTADPRPAGWYDDPEDSPTDPWYWRYWDGTEWTDDTRVRPRWVFRAPPVVARRAAAGLFIPVVLFAVAALARGQDGPLWGWRLLIGSVVVFGIAQVWRVKTEQVRAAPETRSNTGAPPADTSSK